MSRENVSKKKGFGIPKPIIPTDIKSKFPIAKETLLELRERVNERITFSFNFFDRETDLFNLGSMENRNIPVCSEWFITLLDSLKEVSGLTRNELIAQRQHYEFHDHDWTKLRRKYNFSEDFLEQVDCVQFRLTASKGRVHGFMVGNRFYIIWLDPHHNLYPNERFGGEKYYRKPETCFEKLNSELVKLKVENQQLMNLLDERTS